MKANRNKLVLLVFFMISIVLIYAIPAFSYNKSVRSSIYNVENFMDRLYLEQCTNLVSRNLSSIKNGVVRCHNDIYAAVLAETLIRLPATQAAKQNIYNQSQENISLAVISLWRAVALLDYFCIDNGWFPILKEQPVFVNRTIFDKIEKTMKDLPGTRGKLMGEGLFRRILKDYLSEETMKVVIASIILQSIEDENGDITKAMQFMLKEPDYNRPDYMRSAIRWLSLTEGEHKEAVDVVLDFCEKQENITKDLPESVREVTLRLIGLKGEDTPVIDKLAEDAVTYVDMPEEVFSNPKSVATIKEIQEMQGVDDSNIKAMRYDNNELYNLGFVTRQLVELRNLETKQQQIEYLVSALVEPTIVEPGSSEKYRNAYQLSARLFPQEVMLKVLDSFDTFNVDKSGLTELGAEIQRAKVRCYRNALRRLASGINISDPHYEEICIKLQSMADEANGQKKLF
jgi:hypothetical protein